MNEKIQNYLKLSDTWLSLCNQVDDNLSKEQIENIFKEIEATETQLSESWNNMTLLEQAETVKLIDDQPR